MIPELSRWKERFDEYMAMRGFSLRTRINYTGELKPFFEYLARAGVTTLARLTREHLEGYREHLFYLRSRGRNLTLSTQRVRLNAVKRFARFLAQEGLTLLDVGASMELPSVPQRLPRVVLTESETERLLEAPDVSTPVGLRDRALLEMLYATGLRNSEASGLFLEHVDVARRVVHVVCGKGGKDRLVPLGEEAEVWLEEYLAQGRPQLVRRAEQACIFLSSRGERMKPSVMAMMVARWARRAGLEKHVTPHVLRHSMATHMLRHGADLRYLQVLLGHSSPDTTQLYTRVEIGDLRKVLLRCHPRERS